MHTRGKAALLLAAVLVSLGLSGCGQKAQRSAAVNVKAMKVMQQTVAPSTSYAGQVKSVDAVVIKPRVSGTIVEKYISSGQMVEEGQPLYKIDDRQYSSEVLSAQSNVDKALTTLNNSQIDLGRYQKLAATGAIAEQTLTTQQATVDTNESNYQDMQALLTKAQENLEDTVVRSPIRGKLSLDDVSNGTYVTSGNTALVSVGSVNPIYVQFSISENELLNFQQNAPKRKYDDGERPVPPTATLTLSNGTKLSETSTEYQIDREVSQSTGTITAKAIFENKDHLLLPGMFAKITITGAPRDNVLLIPERAVQQVLDKSFVMVVGDDNKSVAKTVTLGNKVGSYYTVEKGLSADDTVVVEGLTNLKEGQPLSVTMTTGDELGLSMMDDDSTLSDASSSSNNG